MSEIKLGCAVKYFDDRWVLGYVIELREKEAVVERHRFVKATDGETYVTEEIHTVPYSLLEYVGEAP